MVDSPPVLLGDTILAATAASVSFVVPTGYDVLLLYWNNVYITDNELQGLLLTLVSGAGEYDYSRQAHNAASTTTHTADYIKLDYVGDNDGVKQISSGYVTIFNRASQEKVVIGYVNHFDNSGGGGADDCEGLHLEGKDRDTSSAITSITITAENSKLFATTSRFILLGIATKDGR